MITTAQLDALMGHGGNVVAEDGKKIGKIKQIFLDDATGRPEWVTAQTGLFGGGESFIPLADGTINGDDITVPYAKDKVKDAPHSDDADGHLSPEQENELYRFYGVGGVDTDAGQDRPANRHDTTGDVGHDTSGPNTDDAITRSEEQLHVGTRSTKAGTARLRKYIVTEEQRATVPVSHDEVHVTREPITDANRDAATSGDDLSEEEHEVTLMADEVVTEKEAVPVERIALDTDTVTEQQEVTEDVRKEQVEFDDGRPTAPKPSDGRR